MGTERIAIVGIGLRYPDAGSPDELWENVLAGRRAFRRVQQEWVDHWSPDPDTPVKAALLRDAELDPVEYQATGAVPRSAELVHWLGINVASLALTDARFPDGEGLPKQSTGVVVGDCLATVSRAANLMRLRWPHVRRSVGAVLAGAGWPDEKLTAVLGELEAQYLAPYSHTAGGMPTGGPAGSVARGISDYFELGEHAYTVDGAWTSSLLPVVTAARALSDGEVDVAIAGGVDLSIDPFQVADLASTGALASGGMTVYDRDSAGFWPGEGVGLVVLMRERDAVAQRRRVYASITGWGVAGEGLRATSRPATEYHRALQRAYDRAGYGVETVSYFEGHGAATAVGDADEIEALSAARRAADPAASPAALSSITGNLGQARAAAGIVGLIKAALSVYHQVIPPATGHHEAHPALHGDSSAMHLPDRARLWPADGPVRAGVSAMGSGGVNTHVAIEEAAGRQRRTGLGKRTEAVVSGRQDAELLLLDAPDTAHLRDRLARLAGLVPKLALAELADLAGLLATQLSGQRFRAALVVTDQEDAQRKLVRLLDMIDSGQRGAVAMHDGLFLASRATPPRIAYLFPGQGCGRGTADTIRRRFAVADGVFRTFRVPTGDHQDGREVAQPRIVASSVAALRVLESVGVDAHIAVGHSLGELTALCWAGAMGGAQLLRLASARGQIMAQESRGGGGMASLATGPVRARDLIDGGGVVIAAYNAPQQTVISGIAADVDRVCVRAQSDGVQVTRIGVAHAFHSPLVRPVADVMAERLAELRFAPLRRSVVSTVTGELLDPATDLRDLLRGQVVRPVRFHQAAATAVSDVDLAIEIGPGRVLTGLLDQIAPGKPVVSVDTDDRSLSRLLAAVGAAYAFGVTVDTAVLFAGRVVRPLPDELAAAACPVEDVSGAASVIDGVHRFVAEPATLPADTRGIHAVDPSSTAPDRAVDDAA